MLRVTPGTLLLALLTVGQLGPRVLSAPATADAKAKNVVFFLVDDLGWADIGAFGSSFYDTPNVDRLAASGTRFTQAYAACPVCSPTRASILTGKYPVRVGITDYISPGGGNQPNRWGRGTPLLPAPYSDRLALTETTLAEALKAMGFATFFAGKWHLGPEGFFPENQGFDVNRGGIAIGGPYGGKKYFSPYGNPRLEDGPDGEHLPDRLATETVRFIESHRDGRFFAYLSFYSVHTPLIGRPDLVKKYEERRQRVKHASARWAPEGSRHNREVQDHPVYGAMVEAMDAAVGKVLAALDRLGLADDTAVVFFSDNGGLSTSEGHPTSNRPLRAGKGWLYEGGIREPCIVRAPGLTRPGSVCARPIVSTDFFPTILDLVGGKTPDDLPPDGTSIVSLLRDPQSTVERDAIYWHYPHYGNQGASPGGAIRVGDWKLIEWYGNDHVELYDLFNDPSERVDRAAESPGRVADLRRRLAAWRKETGAVMPTENPAAHPKRHAESHRRADSASQRGKWR